MFGLIWHSLFEENLATTITTTERVCVWWEKGKRERSEKIGKWRVWVKRKWRSECVVGENERGVKRCKKGVVIVSVGLVVLLDLWFCIITREKRKGESILMEIIKYSDSCLSMTQHPFLKVAAYPQGYSMKLILYY